MRCSWPMPTRSLYYRQAVLGEQLKHVRDACAARSSKRIGLGDVHDVGNAMRAVSRCRGTVTVRLLCIYRSYLEESAELRQVKMHISS